MKLSYMERDRFKCFKLVIKVRQRWCDPPATFFIYLGINPVLLQDFLGLEVFRSDSVNIFFVYMFDLEYGVVVDGFHHLNTTVVIKFAFT